MTLPHKLSGQDSGPGPGPGQVALITGANTGIGKVTAMALARRGLHLFIACRPGPRSEAALADIRAANPQAVVEMLPLDLADLASVRQCAQTFLTQGLPLHLLINNAGLAGGRGLTASGFELAFGVNHVGHFLLTQLLLDCLKNSAPARIVTLASKAHYRAPGIAWDHLQQPTRALTGWPEYCQAKLANVLFSAELARRLAGTQVTTYAVHPGVVASDVWRAAPWPIPSLIKPFMLSVEDGAKTTLHCALSPDAAQQSGLYYDKSHPKTPSRLARDEALAAELWRRSEAWVG